MPSTSSDMINIRCHTSFRWVAKSGCICKRNALSEPTRNSDLSNMVLKPLPWLWETMHLSSTFPHSNACTQCSMWTAFGHTFHHYQTHPILQNNSHPQSYIHIAWNKLQLIGSWTYRSSTLSNKISNCIQLSKHANSFTRASGSPRTKFSKSFLISWRNSTQWGPLLPKGGGMIQVDIGVHLPSPLGPPPLFLLAFQFPYLQHSLLFLAVFRS